jgi:hypothetical protein
MGIYEELQARGLIAQVTDEEEVRELVNNGKATFLHRLRRRPPTPCTWAISWR